MVTSPITTHLFHSRVLALLSSAQSHATRAADGDGQIKFSPPDICLPITVPPLSPVDTDLSPDESMSQIVAITSSWIDLCSPDPLVADVSKQVLMLEIAYAAFCGISYLLIPGPRLRRHSTLQTGLMPYARAIQEALAIGSYMQIKIWFPMIDHPENELVRMGDLAPFARPDYLEDGVDEDSLPLDLYGTWDAWNVIRSFCKYHTRLCVGKKPFAPMQVVLGQALSNTHTHKPVPLLTVAKCSTHTSQTLTTSQYSDKMVFRACQVTDSQRHIIH